MANNIWVDYKLNVRKVTEEQQRKISAAVTFTGNLKYNFLLDMITANHNLRNVML